MFRSEDRHITKQPIDTKSANNSGANKSGSDRNANIELGIAEAPDSLASSNHGDMMDGGGLLYVPELADLPEFEMLPDFLDLPNIAFDESYGPSGKIYCIITCYSWCRPRINVYQ